MPSCVCVCVRACLPVCVSACGGGDYRSLRASAPPCKLSQAGKTIRETVMAAAHARDAGRNKLTADFFPGFKIYFFYFFKSPPQT